MVFRDEKNLRILNGQTDNVAPVLASQGSQFSCPSATAWEYPVIADTDHDGSANICVTKNGSLICVYESAGIPWTPTRPVWNQVNYEPLSINDNLTVPTHPVPKNKEWNGKHPYNGALIQVPIVDAVTFEPVIPASDAAITHISIEEFSLDSVYFYVTVTNLGVKSTNLSLPVAFYTNATCSQPAFRVRTMGLALTPGESTILKFGLRFSELFSHISVRVQDNGTTFPAGFTGRDTLEYVAVCNKKVYHAKAIINIAACPDNIVESDCFDDPQAVEWGMQKIMESPLSDVVSDLSIPLVGDIDNDGKTEIIIPATSDSE